MAQTFILVGKKSAIHLRSFKVYDFGMLKGSWIETEVAMTFFNHPEWIIAYSRDGKINFAPFRVYNTQKRKVRNLVRIASTNNLLGLVSKDSDSNSTKTLIFDCFRLYGQAMESIQNSNCFLSLWQLIENACISETFHGNTEDVTKRINIIAKETGHLNIEIEGFYRLVSRKRNYLVHKGIDSTDNSDSNILKILAEAAISWLIEKEKSLKTKTHLNEYFRLRTKNKKDKLAIIETFRHLDKNHK